MRAQTAAAVGDADVALFLIDARAGVTPLDQAIARWLRSADTVVIPIANKAEGRAAEPGIMEMFALGLAIPVPARYPCLSPLPAETVALLRPWNS